MAKLLLNLCIGYEDESLRHQAEALSKQLHLPLNNHIFPRLFLTSERLQLEFEHFSPLFVDFDSKDILRRSKAGKNQGLIKACKPAPGLKIVDATAGWGRDAALLASFGAKVLMLERQPIMMALLYDGLKRLQNAYLDNRHLSLKAMDALTYFEGLTPSEYPDVIYIDPMHPEREKSSLVKKDMQALQQLIGADFDALALLARARTVATQRVVMKWPQNQPPLMPPNYSIIGKTIRFDVFTPVR